MQPKTNKIKDTSAKHLYDCPVEETSSRLVPDPPLALNLRTLPLIPPEVVKPELCGLVSGFDAPPDGGAFAVSPESERRAISARTAPNHLISSSSVGAHSNKVLLVVIILNVWAVDGPSLPPPSKLGGDDTEGG